MDIRCSVKRTRDYGKNIRIIVHIVMKICSGSKHIKKLALEEGRICESISLLIFRKFSNEIKFMQSQAFGQNSADFSSAEFYASYSNQKQQKKEGNKI